MSRRQRIRRPHLRRTGPIRHSAGLFREPGNGSVGNPIEAEDAEVAEEPVPSGIRDGVELGYGVIDDYLRQGRHLAGLLNGRGRQEGSDGNFGGAGFGDGAYGGDGRFDESAGDRRYGGARIGGSLGDFDFLATWLRASRELTEASFMALASLLGANLGGGPGHSRSSGERFAGGVRGNDGGYGGDYGGWASAAAEPSAGAAPMGEQSGRGFREPWGDGARSGFSDVAGTGSVLQRISIEVVATRPVRVALDLDPEAEPSTLIAAPLEHGDRRFPPLDTARFVGATDRDSLALRIEIPTDTDGGPWVGKVLDSRSGRARGCLTVTVEPAPRRRAAPATAADPGPEQAPSPGVESGTEDGT